ncbi:MAG TPA: alkaline phosphatase D family protein [Flavobacteriales bacterium]|nr:alkaline phosphatase D family protein [Flavobacteriales bacterium]
MKTNGIDQLAYIDNPTFRPDTIGAFSFWYKPTTVLSADARMGIIGVGQKSATAGFFWISQRFVGFTTPANTPLLEVGFRANTAGAADLITASTTLVAGQRSHWVAQTNGSTIMIYRDGVLQTANVWLGSNTGKWMGGLIETQHRLTVGCEFFGNAPSNYGDQEVDEVMYFNRSLTGPEITSLYNIGSPVDPRKLFSLHPTMASACKMYVRCGDRYSSGVLRNRIGSATNDWTLVGPPTFVTPSSDELSIAPSVSVGDTTARISFATRGPATVTVKYSADPALASPSTSGSVTLTSATDFTGRIDISGLSANTTYYYTIVVNGMDQTTSSFPSFKTFVANGAATSFSFAFGSCTAHYGTVGSDTIFDAIPAGARFMLHLGDLIYADVAPAVTTLAGFRGRMQTKLKGGVTHEARYKALRKTRPVFTTWDDHDITSDYDQGPLTAIYLAAKQAMQEYLAAQNPNSPTSGELYYTFQYGDVGFFVIDSRSFRSTKASTDNGSKTQLGSVQLAALKSWLLTNKTAFKVKVICTSTPMHGYAANTGGDSFGGQYDTFQVPTGANGYRTERNDIWDYIDANQIPGVIALSGDQHWSGAFKTTHAGRARYEFTSSPLNQSGADFLTPVAVTADPTNGPVFFKYNGANNVGVVTIDTSVSPATVSFQLYGPGGSLGSSNLKTIDTNAIDAGL